MFTGVVMKKCIDCCELKKLELFPKSKKYNDGRRPYCKKCRIKHRRKKSPFKESILQQDIVKYLRLMKIMVFHVPNGGVRTIKTGGRLKREGLLSGVSDLIILLNSSKTLFVELKTEKGRQSLNQKRFQKDVEKLGFEYKIWRSLDDAINFVNCLKK